MRSQYKEFFVVVNALLDGEAVTTCPYIWVDRDFALVRGWVQGFPKKLGSIHMTRHFPTSSKAGPDLAAGGRFAGTLAANDRRLAFGAVTLERESAEGPTHNDPPLVNVRHFPRLAAGHHDDPAVHELVRARSRDRTISPIWEGSAELELHEAPGEELAALAPVRVGQGLPLHLRLHGRRPRDRARLHALRSRRRGMSRAALVTGGGTGIGAAIARRLRADGYDVCITGRRREPLDAVAAETGALPVQGDTGDPGDAERAVAAAKEAFGRLDVLVCNAGIGLGGTVEEQSPEGWDAVLRTNLTGAFLACRAALPELVRAKGSVVTISSDSGLRAAPASAAYCTAKAGLIMLTQCIALDYGPRGVRANCICPGWIRTPMADEEMDELAELRGTDREGAYELVASPVPLRRPGLPDEIAAAVAWLASDEAGFTTGAVIAIDGGNTVVDPSATVFAP